MNRRRFLTLSNAPSAAVLLSGCGFRQRGSESKPRQPALSLEGDDNSALAQQLHRLQQLGTEVERHALARHSGHPSFRSGASGSMAVPAVSTS